MCRALWKLLNVSYNLLPELPDSICNMTSLEQMDVSYNKLSMLPKQMSKCINLQVLDVSHNQLESFPSDLAVHCHDLQALLLDGNPATNPDKTC